MKATLAVGACPFEEPSLDIQERLRRQENELVVLPAAAAEALRLSQDPDCSIAQFAALVERDLKLAADILSLANSAIYSPPTPVGSLQQAVSRLGFQQCKSLIITSSMTSLMKRLGFEQQWIRDVLWRHSLTTAIIAHHLNRTLAIGLQGEEFTDGLIHDFGRTLFAIAFPEKFDEIDPLNFEESDDVGVRERAITGIDHSHLGAWFVERSGLPEAFVEVALLHHDCGDASRLTALTAAADHLANHLQKYLAPEEYNPAENPGIRRLVELTGDKAATRFRKSAVTILEDSAQDLVELTRRL